MANKLQVERIDGELKASGLRFGIVVSRFNSFITERLLAAAVDALERAGAAGEDVDVVRVPGAFELPLAAKKLAASGRYDALIAIGCVLRGETTHYDYVCSETARGLQLAQMDIGLPIIFCVLTCDTLEQAIDRAGLKGGNKGFEAGLAAIEMAQLSRKLREAHSKAAPAGRRRTRRALLRTNFLKARPRTPPRWTQLSSSTRTIGGSNGSRPSIAPFCAWRFMR